MSPRTLTHDERKAAEAAFTGQPFHPSWSIRARTIYDGILATLGLGRHHDAAHHDIPMTPPRAFAPSETDTPRPLQVWHLSLTSPDARLLLLFPWHMPMAAVLHYLNSKYQNRPMTLQAIEGGQHPCVADHCLILARPIVSSREATLLKGQGVIINGRLQQRRWETEDNQKRSKHEIVAHTVSFMPKRETGQAENPTGHFPDESSAYEDATPADHAPV